MHGDIWEPQINGLKANHQIAWFDNRGIGESTRGPKSRWTMDDMASDALCVIDSLGWDRCHLVGVSMGGMIAQELALKASDRLSSLTLIVTHAGGYTLQKLPTLQGLRSFLAVNRPGPERRVEALKSLLYPEEYLTRADQAALTRQMKLRIGRPLPRSTVMGQLSAMARHDTRKRLGALHVPTLIIKASKDILIRPSASDRLQTLIPNSRVVEIADAGHGVIFQSAALVNQALAEHFASTQPG
jgi:pimeloyl-ACP methyl ester carboxylesterase